MLKIFHLSIAAFFIPAAAYLCYQYFLERKKSILFSLFSLIILFSAFSWVSLYYYPNLASEAKAAKEERDKKDNTLVSSMPIGSVINASFNQTNALFFPSSYTTIETKIGFYKVSGSQTIPKGQELNIELRASGREYVCYVNSQNCMRLISN